MPTRVHIQQGRLVLRSSEPFEREEDTPVTWPVDVLLRLSRVLPDDEAMFSLAAYDLSQLVGLGLLDKTADLSGMDAFAQSFTARMSLVRRWKRNDTIADVASAARAATTGQISPRIADHLGRVVFTGEDVAEVPDFRALVAFSVQHVARSGGRYTVRNCALCMKPFLATERATYCRRKAPGSDQTCLQVAKVRDFRKRKRAAKKEKP
jgi:Family of unknown function (DUF6076)